MSDGVVRQAVIGVESTFRTPLADDLAEVLDKALWVGGTVTSGGPIGMVIFTGSSNAGSGPGAALASGDLYVVEKVTEQGLEPVDGSSVWWRGRAHLGTDDPKSGL